MTEAEMLQVVGTLTGAYVVGFCCGYAFTFFKQFMEKI